MDLTNKWKLFFDFILKLTFGFKVPDLFIYFQFSYKVGCSLASLLTATFLINRGCFFRLSYTCHPCSAHTDSQFLKTIILIVL